MPKKINKVLKYFALVIIGLLILLFSSLINHVKIHEIGEYTYSKFLGNNYSILSICIFLIVGFLIGLKTDLNPWLSGISLILIFPIIAFYEGIVYQGSHNLIPFELIGHFILSLPSIAGVYLGKLIKSKM